MILGLIGSMMSDSPSEDLVEPKDTATPTPPPTRPPTVTVAPTATSTPIPDPTDTPAPTLIPTPVPQCPTPSEAAYLADYDEAITPLGEYLLGIAGLFAQAETDVELLVDTDWLLQMAVYLFGQQAVSDALLGIEAPTEATEDMQDAVVLMALALATNVELYAAGIDELDLDKLLRGAAYVELANTRLNEVQDARAAICA